MEHVERPTARPAFREALREQFLSGAAVDGAPAAATNPVRADAIRTQNAAALPPPRRRNVWVLTGALAAAAAIVVMLLLNRDRTPSWRVHGSSTAETVIVDGIPMHLADGAKLARAISTARELETQGGTLRLCVRDEAWIELGDDTRLSQMRFAAAGPYEIRTDRGSLRVATLPAFDGRGMRVRTQDMLATVTGTVFAVDIDPMGTCLCTLEGTVQCAPVGGAAPQPVPAGRMCLAYRDGSAPDWQPAYAPHLEPLKRLLE